MKILFVCTGNTCRSPLAEYLLKAKLAEREIDWQVGSAGLHSDGGRININSRKLLAERGIDSSEFVSRQLTAEMVKESNYVVCMTTAHKSAIQGASNVFTIDELTGCGEVLDPFGQGEGIYERSARQLHDAMETLIAVIEESGI